MYAFLIILNLILFFTLIFYRFYCKNNMKEISIYKELKGIYENYTYENYKNIYFLGLPKNHNYFYDINKNNKKVGYLECFKH